MDDTTGLEAQAGIKEIPAFAGISSGANGIRTRDLLLAKQALSQLSYGPDPRASLRLEG